MKYEKLSMIRVEGSPTDNSKGYFSEGRREDVRILRRRRFQVKTRFLRGEVVVQGPLIDTFSEGNQSRMRATDGIQMTTDKNGRCEPFLCICGHLCFICGPP